MTLLSHMTPPNIGLGIVLFAAGFACGVAAAVSLGQAIRQKLFGSERKQ